MAPLLLPLILLGGGMAAFLLVLRLAYQYASMRRQLIQARQERVLVSDFLNHFSRSLAKVAEVDHAMQLVANYLSELLHTESLAVYTVEVDPADKTETLRGAAVAGPFPSFQQRTADIVLSKAKYRLEHFRHEHLAVGQGVLGRVAEVQKSLLITTAAEFPLSHELPAEVETLMTVPMHVEGRFVGLICAVNCREEARRFTEDDLQMLESMSHQAALASNLVRIYSERSKQERILQELAFGREIQRSLLPKGLPVWGDYVFAAFSQPALEVAGDYYDFVTIDEDRLMIVVADAAGKGVPACMLMAMCRSLVQSLVEQYAGVERFLEECNPRLFRGTDPAHFLTMGVVVIDKKTHVCEYGSAGHTALLMKTPNGVTRAVHPDGPALGLLPGEIHVDFDILSFCFHPGTQLLLFTDGITEALNEEGEEFGLERLQQLWEQADLAPEELQDRIVAEVRAFRGSAPQFDDETMIVIAR